MGQSHLNQKYRKYKFIMVYTVIMLMLLLMAYLSSCASAKVSEDDDAVYINIDGEDVELVLDEYENPYLKYNISGKNIFIPYPFEFDDEEERDFKNEYTSNETR